MAKIDQRKARQQLRRELVQWALDQERVTGKLPTKTEVKAKAKEMGAKAGLDMTTIMAIVQLIMQLIALFKKPVPPPPTP